MILFFVVLIGTLCASANPCQPPSFVMVETKDGAAICIKRYPADGRPVLIAHGISSNHRFWDLNEQYSLARYLSQKGFDVYNMDFRGHGNAIYDAKGVKQKSGWSIDSYGVYDIEAAVSYISSQNPSKPSYIGHSLGGMALISYMGHHTSEALSTIAVVGTPFDFQHKEALLHLAQKGSQYAFFTVPTPFLARLVSLFNKTPAHLDHMLWGPENIAPEIRKSLFQNIVSPMTPRELRHLYRSLDAQSYIHY
ncbi:MAG: alpha/beta fold hydrolase, partial [Myxococcota bacterium]|nr:alpha/beta fold hydrolase [Myxococcota bacterium]